MQANYRSEPVTYRALPLFILVAALALFGMGWAVENEVNVKSSVFENILKPESAPTAQVVVVPNNNQAPVAPKVIPAPPVVIPAVPAVPSNNPVQLPAPAPAPVTGQAPVVAAAPVITVTATLQPTLPPVTATTVLQASGENENGNVGGHCSQWTNEGCAVYPTATTAPTYQPPVVTEATATPLPPTPTITPTPLPDNNSISSIVTLQGSKNHGNTSIIVTGSSGVIAHMVTNEGGLFQGMGLENKFTNWLFILPMVAICLLVPP